MATDVCTHCGSEIREQSRFCQQCGAPTNDVSPSAEAPQPRRTRKPFLKWAGIGCGSLIGLFIMLVIIGVFASNGSEVDAPTERVSEPPTLVPTPAPTPDSVIGNALIAVDTPGPTSIPRPTAILTPRLTPKPNSTLTHIPVPTATSIRASVATPTSTLAPTPEPAAISNHDGFDHINLGRLWPITAADFDAYCGIIRDEYWHFIRSHDGTTFVFINVAAVQLEFTSNEIATRLTLCGLDLNGEDCLGPACDWEAPPKLLPDGQFVPLSCDRMDDYGFGVSFPLLIEAHSAHAERDGPLRLLRLRPID